MRDTLIVHYLKSKSWRADRECYDWFSEYQAKIQGTTGTTDEEIFFTKSVSKILEWPVAQMYADTYLHKEDKDRISDLVDEIPDAYHSIISEADFLSEETRAKALDEFLDFYGIKEGDGMYLSPEDRVRIW